MTTHYQTKPIASTRWRLDPTASTAQFRVPHFWGLVTVKGHFANVDGWLELDHDGTGQLELTIDTTSLTTGNSSRDRHLRSADFFDADQHPQVRFRSTHVGKPTDSELSVAGELRVAGNEVTLTLQPTIRQTGERLRVDATTTVDQRQLGMTWRPLGMTKTPTTLTVHAELIPGS
ncbi:MAG: YceI family protein [Solirubrobacteraceae bacterium]